MSTTTNLVMATTLTAAAFVGGALLIPTEGDGATDGGVVDGGQRAPLVGAFYLRFPDKQAWEQAAKEAGGMWEPAMAQESFCDRWGTYWLDGGTVDAGCISQSQRLVETDAGTLSMSGMGHAIDVVGTIVLPGPDGGTETLDGWHVNFQGVLPEAWRPYLVQPANPVRTWAR